MCWRNGFQYLTFLKYDELLSSCIILSCILLWVYMLNCRTLQNLLFLFVCFSQDFLIPLVDACRQEKLLCLSMPESILSFPQLCDTEQAECTISLGCIVSDNTFSLSLLQWKKVVIDCSTVNNGASNLWLVYPCWCKTIAPN